MDNEDIFNMVNKLINNIIHMVKCTKEDIIGPTIGRYTRGVESVYSLVQTFHSLSHFTLIYSFVLVIT